MDWIKQMSSCNKISVLLAFAVLQVSLRGAGSNVGREFVVGFVGNPFSRNATISVHITNPNTRLNVTGSIFYRDVIARIKTLTTFVILPQKGFVYRIRNSLILNASKRFLGPKSKGLSILTNRPVALYGVFREIPGRSEVFLGLPVSRARRKRYSFIVTCYQPLRNSFSYVTVIAARDMTNVTFKVESTKSVFYGLISYPSGSTFEVFARHSLDAFTIRSSGDLTGTEITATRPISVFAGASLARVSSNVNCTGRLVSPIPEVRDWGRRYIFVPFRSDDYFVRIVGAFHFTQVRIDKNLDEDQKTSMIFKGTFIDHSATDVICSKPCFVMQFWNCHSSGAPVMTMIPPVSRYSLNYYLPSKVLSPKSLEYVYTMQELSHGSEFRASNLEKTPDIGMHYKRSIYFYERRRVNGSGLIVINIFPSVRFYVLVYGHYKGESYGFPGGWILCDRDDPIISDRIDNDCDGKIDEELLNGKDDDGDGRVDEDFSIPPPRVFPPGDITTEACNKEEVFRLFSDSIASGTWGDIKCDDIVITRRDKILDKQECRTVIARVWKVTDGCKNSAEETQLIKFTIPRPVIHFPENTSRRCGESLDESHTGRPKLVKNICGDNNVSIVTRNVVKVAFVNMGARCPWPSLERRFVVKESCGRTWTAVQYIKVESLTTSKRPKTTKTPTTSKRPKTTNAPTSSKRSKKTNTSTTSKRPKTTKTPTTSKRPNTTKTPTTSKRPKTTKTSTTSKRPKTTKTPTTSKRPKTTTTPTTSKRSKTTKTPTTSKRPKTTKTPTTLYVTQDLKEKQEEVDKQKKRVTDIGIGLGLVLALTISIIIALAIMLILRRKTRSANGPPNIALPPPPPPQQRESVYQELNFPNSSNNSNNLVERLQVNDNQDVRNSDWTLCYTPSFERKLGDEHGENTSKYAASDYDDTIPGGENAQKKGAERTDDKGKESLKKAGPDGLVNDGIEYEPGETGLSKGGMSNDRVETNQRPEYLEIIKVDDHGSESEDDGYCEIPDERRENNVIKT